jgi:hypothetical protein
MSQLREDRVHHLNLWAQSTGQLYDDFCRVANEQRHTKDPDLRPWERILLHNLSMAERECGTMFDNKDIRMVAALLRDHYIRHVEEC